MAHPALREAAARGGPPTKIEVSEAFNSTPPLTEIRSLSRAAATWDAEDLSFVGTGSRPSAVLRDRPLARPATNSSHCGFGWTSVVILFALVAGAEHED